MALSKEKRAEHKARRGMFDDFEQEDQFSDTTEIDFFPHPTRGLLLKVRNVEAGPKPMKKKTNRVQICFEVLRAQDGYKAGDIFKWYLDDAGHESYWIKGLRAFASAIYNVKRSQVTGAILEVIFFDVGEDGEECEPAIMNAEVVADIVPNRGGRCDAKGNPYMDFYWHPASKEVAEDEVPF